MAKRKRMTQAEKKFNAEFKKDMQDRGIFPPDKPKLNRKKYIAEAREEWNECDKVLAFGVFMTKAISIMLDMTDSKNRVSQEAVGVAKMLKLSVRLKEFSEKREKEDRLEYTIGELYEYIKDILNA